MKEQGKLIGAITVVATAVGITMEAGRQSNCNDVSWRQEQRGYVSGEQTQNIFQGGHVEVYKDPQSLIGIRFEWDPGNVVGKREIPRGNLTVCSRSSDTVITHRDGREWVVPVTRIDSIKIVNDFLVAGYWAEEKETYVPGDKREVVVVRDYDAVILDSIVSAYSVEAVTEEQIVYNIATPRSWERRVRDNDGTETVLAQERW